MSAAKEALVALPSGVWQHYKGPLYLVLGYGHDSNHEGRDVVVYVGLQLDEAKSGPRLAVRTASDFLALVHLDGSDCPDSRLCQYRQGRLYMQSHQPRFRYLGPTYEPPAKADEVRS